MFVFQKIWRALFSWNTRFEIRPSALLPNNKSTYNMASPLKVDWRNITDNIKFPKTD